LPHEDSISRTYVYDGIQNLINKGLVSYVLKNGRKYFRALNAEKLLDYLDEREKQLQDHKKEIFDCFGNVETVIGEEAKSFVFEKINDYFSQKLFVLDELDWFYLDFITAVTYRSNVNRLSDEDFAEVYPSLNSAIQQYDNKSFVPLIGLVLWTLVKWLIGICVLIVMFGVAERGDMVFAYIAIGLILLRIYIFYKNFNRWNQLKKLSMQILNYFDINCLFLYNLKIFIEPIFMIFYLK
jgi:predicted transcriptional regulator with HTH domain